MSETEPNREESPPLEEGQESEEKSPAPSGDSEKSVEEEGRPE